MIELTDEQIAQGLQSVSGPGGQLTTPKEIANMKLVLTRKVLQLEAVHGIRFSAGYNAYAVVKELFGLRGSKRKVYEEFDAYVTKRTGVPA